MMMKKNFYLVQIGVSFSSPVFLPYAAGCIAAYLKTDGEITEHYHIPDIVVMREKPQEVMKRFHNPDIVAFSCYSWNFEYSAFGDFVEYFRYIRNFNIFAYNKCSGIYAHYSLLLL